VQRSARSRPVAGVPGWQRWALIVWVRIGTSASLRALLGVSSACRVSRCPSGVVGVGIRMLCGEVGIDRTDGAANSRRSPEARNVTAGQGMFGRYL
jgi:hypothetical protein